MSESKCQINGNKIEPCAALAKSLEHDAEYTALQEKPWVGDWKYVPTKEDCNDRPNYEIQALFTAQPVPLTPEGLIKAVRFYEQVKSENPPVETGAWKDAVDWVLEEACQAVNIRIKGE